MWQNFSPWGGVGTWGEDSTVYPLLYQNKAFISLLMDPRTEHFVTGCNSSEQYFYLELKISVLCSGKPLHHALSLWDSCYLQGCVYCWLQASKGEVCPAQGVVLDSWCIWYVWQSHQQCSLFQRQLVYSWSSSYSLQKEILLEQRTSALSMHDYPEKTEIKNAFLGRKGVEGLTATSTGTRTHLLRKWRAPIVTVPYLASPMLCVDWFFFFNLLGFSMYFLLSVWRI